MTQNDLESRLSAVEEELQVLRGAGDGGRGRPRCGGLRAELRAHTRLLAALRETQVQHYDEHKQDAEQIKAGIASIADMLGRLGGER